MRYEHIAFILADSALPTGGFVASSGLEAAVTLGKLSDAGKTAIVKDKVIDFCKLSIASYAQQHVPYVHHVYNAHQISQILLSDDFLDAHIANEMTRRASLAQGISYLTLATKSFANEIKDETCYAWIKELKTLVRQRVAAGHLTTCFALLTRSLGMKRGGLSLNDAMTFSTHRPSRRCGATLCEFVCSLLDQRGGAHELA